MTSVIRGKGMQSEIGGGGIAWLLAVEGKNGLLVDWNNN